MLWLLNTMMKDVQVWTIEYDSMKYQPIIRQEAGEMSANTPLNASVNAGEREYIILTIPRFGVIISDFCKSEVAE